MPKNKTMINNSNKIIAYQGIEGAYSHIATKSLFPNCQYKSYNHFEEVFAALLAGESDYAVLPIENSYAGRVSEIHNLLNQKSLYIIKEKFQKIEHHLCGIKGSSIEKIKTVYSHSQAIMQTNEFFKKYKNIKLENYINTAMAAKYVEETKDPTKAAICSKLSAELYGLEIIQNNIETSDKNYTVFIVLSKNKDDINFNIESETAITALLFSIRNIPGAIYRCLGGFATHRVNLIRFENYISFSKHDKAQFFICFYGKPNDSNVQHALEELNFFSDEIHLLGVYQEDPLRKGL